MIKTLTDRVDSQGDDDMSGQKRWCHFSRISRDGPLLRITHVVESSPVYRFFCESFSEPIQGMFSHARFITSAKYRTVTDCQPASCSQPTALSHISPSGLHQHFPLIIWPTLYAFAPRIHPPSVAFPDAVVVPLPLDRPVNLFLTILIGVRHYWPGPLRLHVLSLIYSPFFDGCLVLTVHYLQCLPLTRSWTGLLFACKSYRALVVLSTQPATLFTRLPT